MRNDYPLPWCEALDAPYWKVNITLCASEAWRKWQAHKPMSEIIPAIDVLINAGERSK